MNLIKLLILKIPKKKFARVNTKSALNQKVFKTRHTGISRNIRQGLVKYMLSRFRIFEIEREQALDTDWSVILDFDDNRRGMFPICHRMYAVVFF